VAATQSRVPPKRIEVGIGVGFGIDIDYDRDPDTNPDSEGGWMQGLLLEQSPTVCQ